MAKDFLLAREKLLFLDCQTTGMRPPAGSLIEIAWGEASVEEGSLETESYLLRLPEGALLPKKVSELTGITKRDLEGAHEPGEAFRALSLRADPTRVAVIHYAQFERPFLADLYRRFGGVEEVPFRILCSHQIATRLFPNLPSRNIRGLAGYFGSTVGEVRRAAAHVQATIQVWQGLVEELSQRGVHSLAQLDAWLASAPREKRTKLEYRVDRIKRLELPDKPGIYRMLSRQGDVLYVGKATSLKDRVNSYFRGRKGRETRKLEMLTRVWDIEVVECGSALEAALLENDEIKRRDPPYNVSLKAARRRILFYSRDFSEVSFTPGPACSFGPFRQANAVEQIKQLISALQSGKYDDIFYEPIPAEVLAEGYAVFVAWFGLEGRILTVRDYLAVGMRLLREERKLVEEESDEMGSSAEEEEPEVDPEEPLSPEEIAGKYLRLLVRAASEYRKAKSLTRLLDADISWEEGDTGWKTLSFRRGRIHRPEDPDSPFLSHPWVDLELTDFDRMSVLLTELARRPSKIVPCRPAFPRDRAEIHEQLEFLPHSHLSRKVEPEVRTDIGT
jgi:DNA polymerase-3 subunit epsilon